LVVYGALLISWLIASLLLISLGGAIAFIVTTSVCGTAYVILYGITRAGHRLCLVTTLLTTAGTWLYAKDAIHSSPMAWMVALATGVAAGFVVELLRLATSRFGESVAHATALVKKPFVYFNDDKIDWATPVIEKVFGFPFGDTKPARFMRHILLG
jgi:hypothetical protein